MKAFGKLVMLLAVLAICMPAYGQPEPVILIYAKTIDCWWAELDDGWDGDEDHITGFLVLEAGYDSDTGELLFIERAEQIEYWKDSRGKWYWQLEERYYVERVELDGEVIWVIEWVFAEAETAAQIVMVRGKPRKMNVGLGRDEDDKKEVARVLKGCSLMLYVGMGVEKEMCKITWRLQQRWTRLANHEDECDRSFDCAVYGIVKYWLERRGYEDLE